MQRTLEENNANAQVLLSNATMIAYERGLVHAQAQAATQARAEASVRLAASSSSGGARPFVASVSGQDTPALAPESTRATKDYGV